MTAGWRLPPVVRKEICALLPAWIACLVALAAAAAADDPRMVAAGVFAYAFGSIGLGAQSMGHEYAHRTLGILLAQPCDRRRIFATKLAVLAAMLAVLAAFAYGAFSSSDALGWSYRVMLYLILLPACCGLLLAPWLTMVGRSALAGLVFTLAIPGATLVVCEAIGAVKYGAASAEVDVFRLAVWPNTVLALCAFAAIFGWHRFMRLEAIDGTGAEIHLTRWFAGGRERAGHPIWRLVQKEFHLQQLTLVLVGVYVAGWATVWALKYVMPEFREFPIIPATMLYLALLAILMGSLASAEERQFGTLEWQILLPVAAWQQWLVKAGTVLALAFAFGIGLPALLIYIDPSAIEFRDALAVWRQTAVMIVLLTTGSLYVSSLSTSGLRALVVSFPTLFGTAVLFTWTMNFVWWTFARLVLDPAGPRLSVRGQRSLPAAAYEAIVLALVGGFVLLLIVLAFQNHRSTDRRLKRVLPQIACIAAFLAAGVMVWAGVLVWSYSG